MRVTVIGGAASTGKTSIMMYTLQHIVANGISPAVVKIDCLDAGQDRVYASLGIRFAMDFRKVYAQIIF